MTKNIQLTGGVKAGGSIQAENIVTGVQAQGGDTEMAQKFLDAAQQLKSGGVEAAQDIITRNIVTGFQYLGHNGQLSREQFEQELVALRAQLAQAIQANEIEDAYEAEDVQQAVERAIEQTQAEQPEASKISGQLEKAATIIESAAKTAQAAKMFGATIIKLAPVVMGLVKAAELFF